MVCIWSTFKISHWAISIIDMLVVAFWYETTQLEPVDPT